MATGQGVTSKAAFKIETGAWGSAITCGAGNQIHIISESVKPSTEYESSVHLDGRGGVNSIYNTIKKYQGETVIEGHYSGMEALLACALGASHQDVSPVSTSTDANRHWFDLSNDLSLRAFDNYEMNTPSGNAIRRGTLAFEKTVSIHENASSVINTLSMEATPERVTLTMNIASHTQAYENSTNTDSSTWTVPTGDQILFDDMTVYIKARDEFTIAAANDTFIIDEGGGDITLDIADDTYTGYGLAMAIALAANDSGSLSGVYDMDYDENNRAFKIFTTNSQTFSVTGTTMQMATTVGMTVDSDTALITRSNFDAEAIFPTAFDSGDKIGVSQISWSLENALDIESQDSESSLKILEPERNGWRKVTGSIEIPRYQNDTFLKAANGSTTYMINIEYSGAAIDSENQEFVAYIPQFRITNASAPIAGPEIIKQTLAFEAHVPINFFDFVNFTEGAYFWRVTAAAAVGVDCLGVYTDGMYGGSGESTIVKWDGTSWSTNTDLGTNGIHSIKQFDGKLYVGGDAGTLFRSTTGASDSWSTNTNIGTGIIKDMIQFGDYLYFLERPTGKVFRSSTGDKDDWSSSTDTTATTADSLETYGGALYMIGSDGATFTRVYTTTTGALDAWSTSCDFGVGVSTVSLIEHRGKLYASGAFTIYVYDGTTWTSLGSTGKSIKHLVSYRGQLLIVVNSEDVYIVDTTDATNITNIYSALSISPAEKPLIYDGNLFIADGDTTVNYFKPMKELAISNQSELGTNPL